jgi:hypothetical protein
MEFGKTIRSGYFGFTKSSRARDRCPRNEKKLLKEIKDQSGWVDLRNTSLNKTITKLKRSMETSSSIL